MLILATSLVLGGCSLIPTSAPAPAPSPSPSPSPLSSPQALPTYSLDQVAAHASPPADCWLVIDGKVYDVSNFDSKHPGKQAVYQGCGKDATELFNTRPMGSNTPHSDTARSFLPQFEIGSLTNLNGN